MTMKENWKETTFDSRCLGRETDALAFGSKERYVLNDSRMDASLIELEAKDRDDCSKFKVADDSSIDDENETMASPWKEGQNGLSHHLIIDNGTIDFPGKESKDGQAHHVSSWDKDADSLSSDSSDMEKEQGSPECKSFDTVEELEDCNGSSPLFTDKSVLGCDLPELEVCYKEIDCQILKDICVDEGRPEKDSNTIESSLFPLPPNDDGLGAKEDPSMDADSFTADQCGRKGEIDGKKFISQENIDSCLENIVETSEACSDGAGKAETNSSDDSGADGDLPNENFGSLPGQVLDQEAVPETLAASSAEAGGTGKDVQASCLAYNSKIENGTIIFNFSSPDGVVVGNSLAEDVKEQSAESGDMHNDVNTDKFSVTMEAQAQCTSNRVDDSHQQSLVSNEGNSDGGSTTSNAQCITSEGSPKHKQENSDDIAMYHGPVESPSNKSPVATNDAHTLEANAPTHDKRESGDVSVANQLQQDMGETSFSAASMITYSGPIAYSGSLSHRSDGSTTSGKSFAFPVLQSEWNSSPVRMAKADRRDFRKHKGWRSGLLCCCRF